MGSIPFFHTTNCQIIRISPDRTRPPFKANVYLQNRDSQNHGYVVAGPHNEDHLVLGLYWGHLVRKFPPGPKMAFINGFNNIVLGQSEGHEI